MKISSVHKIGFTVTLAIVLLIWGISFLKGYRLFDVGDVYYVKYPKANGLMKANPIMINGLQAGQVRKIYFDNDMSGNIIVELLVEYDFKVPKNSVALLYSADIMGSKAVTLKMGDSDKYLQSGDTIKGEIEISMMDVVSQEVGPIKDKATKLMTTVDTVMGAVFNVRTQEHLALVISNLAFITQNLSQITANQQAKINSILGGIDSLSTVFKRQSSSLANTLKNVSAISDSIAQSNLKHTLSELEKASVHLAEISRKINQGEGTAGKLVNNDTLYYKMQDAVKSLDALLIDLKEHPKRYINISVFGGKKE